MNIRALRIAICALAVSTVSQIAIAPAHAEDNTNVWTCWDVGGPPPEPVGDRPGHTLTYNQDLCRIESGPLVGGIATGDMSWEWDGPNSKELTFRLIVHKPGASAVLRGTSGGMALIMTDGKVTGVHGVGTLRLRVDDRQLDAACRQVRDMDVQRHRPAGLLDRGQAGVAPAGSSFERKRASGGAPIARMDLDLSDTDRRLHACLTRLVVARRRCASVELQG